MGNVVLGVLTLVVASAVFVCLKGLFWREKTSASMADLQQALDHLEQSNRVKDDVIAMAAHQLRPNITAAQGFIQLLEKSEHTLSADQKELADLAAKSIAVYGGYDQYARCRCNRNGQLALDVASRPIDIADAVAEEVAVVRARFPGRNIEFSNRLPSSGALVRVDVAKNPVCSWQPFV